MSSSPRAQSNSASADAVYRLRLAAGQKPNHADWILESDQECTSTQLVYRLGARDARTLAGFTHGGWKSASDYFTSCNTTRGELMFRLKATAEGKSRGPRFLADDLAY